MLNVSYSGGFIRVLFYGCVLVITTATLIYGVGYYNRASEFSTLLNNMVKRRNGIMHQSYTNSQSRVNRHQNMGILALISFFLISTAIAFLGFIPAVKITLELTNSCEAPIPFPKILHFNDLLRIFYILITMPTIYLACLIGLLTTIIWITVIKELRDSLNFFLLQFSCNCNAKSMHHFIKIYYRQLQLFTMLINRCLQIHFWPVLEFVGSLVGICLLYTFVKYHALFNIYVRVILVASFVTTSLFIWVMFGIASQSLLLSSKLLARSKCFAKRYEQSVGFKKFVRSCPPSVLKVGDFHKKDQNSAPGLIRFILQRTVFLLVKSVDMVTVQDLFCFDK